MPFSAHHLNFPKKTHERAGRANRQLVHHPELIIPMVDRFHNIGKESLHANVGGVPILPEYMAREVLSLFEAHHLPDEYLHNLDSLVFAYASMTAVAENRKDLETALEATQAIYCQRIYIVRSLGVMAHAGAVL